MSFTVGGERGLQKVARAYRDGDKVMRRAIGRAARDVAKPLGEAVVREGAQTLPARGGLRQRVRTGGRVTVTSQLGGPTPRVTMTLRNRYGYQLGRMERGELRHPIWPRVTQSRDEWDWAEQRVPAGKFTAAFERLGTPMLQRRTLAAMRRAADDVASRAT